MATITIELPDEQYHQLEIEAHEAGYSTLEEYLVDLLSADLDEGEDEEDLEASFRRAWIEMKEAERHNDNA
jgi:hypothetical protein